MLCSTFLTAGLLCLGLGIHSAAAQNALHNSNPAQALFECTAKTMGQVACQAGVRCKCMYDAFGSAMTGLPPGYRWNCDLQQGNCMNDVPAGTSGNYGAPAPSLPTPNVVIPYPSTGTNRTTN